MHSATKYEIRTHKRLMQIIDPTEKTVDALSKLDLPAGVEVQIRSQPEGRGDRLAMTIGIVGRKAGMTRVFTARAAESIPVTVIRSAPHIASLKSRPGNRRRLSCRSQVTTGEKKPSRVNKALTGHYKKAGVAAGRVLVEFRLKDGEGQDFAPGAELKVTQFEGVKAVDVTGTSLGKGFAGWQKRWNFGGGRASHGNSLSHRRPGSIGQRQSPGKVWKGMKMAGHMGNERVTSLNLGPGPHRRRTQSPVGQGRSARPQGCRRSRAPDGEVRNRPWNCNSIRATEQPFSVADSVFGAEFNEPLIHQVVTAYLAGGRAGTAKQKTKGEVRGGGKKPWKQKGTGRARVGSIRSPLWRGGGKTHAAVPRDHSQKVNKKMYRGALRSIVSELSRQGSAAGGRGLRRSTAPRPRVCWPSLQLPIGANDILIITDTLDQNLFLSARNLHTVDVIDVEGINPVALLSFKKVLFTAFPR